MDRRTEGRRIVEVAVTEPRASINPSVGDNKDCHSVLFLLRSCLARVRISTFGWGAGLLKTNTEPLARIGPLICTDDEDRMRMRNAVCIATFTFCGPGAAARGSQTAGIRA